MPTSLKAEETEILLDKLVREGKLERFLIEGEDDYRYRITEKGLKWREEIKNKGK